MKRLVDVINFNADASCLPSETWLKSLEGSTGSSFFRWLGLYVDRGKKVVLGLTGASIADIASRNPEAIDLINRHPGVFEILLRPFAHDIALLRTRNGFSINFEYGKRLIERTFQNVASYYLPPEFMLTSYQVMLLSQRGVAGVFINPGRFSEEIRQRIPGHPYRVSGVFGSSLNCIPFCDELTDRYLDSLHRFECGPWNEAVASTRSDPLFSWRDGESPFLMPRGQEREKAWLVGEMSSVRRFHLADLSLRYIPGESLEDHQYKSYPVHSFSAWMKELRMLGFIHRVQEIEVALDQLEKNQRYLWLLAINSDILSSIEKKSPTIRIRESPSSTDETLRTLLRSERGFEGEEYLSALESTIRKEQLPEFLASSGAPHLIKMRTRMGSLERLDASSREETS